MKYTFLFVGFLLACMACQPSDPASTQTKDQIDLSTYWGENPWPEIRKKRINQLLPEALKNAQIDSWLVICRENYNDPIATHVGGENASGTAAFLFYNDQEGFHSLAFSPDGEATALEDLAIHQQVIRVPRGESALAKAVAFIKEKGFSTVAINTSTSNEMADGLTYSQHQELVSLMGVDQKKLVSSEELVYEWLSIKLPEEVEILKKAAQLAADFQEEAYASIVPGKTTDAEVAKFLKAKMAAYGVTDAWHPDQNPNVNSGPDRGHSHAT
ncbi:MAG: aminopeptidase P family protein, partial [Bacteroidota bacterium]